MRLNQQIAEAFGLTFGSKRAHKYGAKRTDIDGIVFPSLKEASRYAELSMLADAGEISELEVDARVPIKYVFEINGLRIGVYRPDFRFRERGRVVCEDVKGMRTPVFNLKLKLFRALYEDTELRII